MFGGVDAIRKGRARTKQRAMSSEGPTFIPFDQMPQGDDPYARGPRPNPPMSKQEFDDECGKIVDYIRLY